MASAGTSDRQVHTRCESPVDSRELSRFVGLGVRCRGICSREAVPRPSSPPGRWRNTLLYRCSPFKPSPFSSSWPVVIGKAVRGTARSLNRAARSSHLVACRRTCTCILINVCLARLIAMHCDLYVDPWLTVSLEGDIACPIGVVHGSVSLGAQTATPRQRGWTVAGQSSFCLVSLLVRIRICNEASQG